MSSYAALADLVPCDAAAHPACGEAPPRIEFAGSILALLSDGSGNFDGFVLEIGRGKERCFETDDLEIAGLVQRAWRERRAVSIVVEQGRPYRPLAVIFEGA
jgi:hypothetical protein